MSGTEEALPLMSADSKAWNKQTLFKGLVGVIIVSVLFILTVYSVESKLSPRKFPADAGFAGTDKFNGKLFPFLDVNQNDQKPSVIKETIVRDVDGTGFTGYLAVVQNAAPHFHVHGSCVKLRKTSANARRFGCRHAINGGPFLNFWNGGCIGPVVRHGHILNFDAETTYASLGKTGDGKWVIGHIDQPAFIQYNITDAITGFGWLVVNGSPAPPEGGQIIKRTAIGIDADGSLMMLQVDGGISLFRLAQLLISQGARYAINLDGGGSSTAVINGVVANSPDCLEIGLPCERAVASMVCVT